MSTQVTDTDIPEARDETSISQALRDYWGRVKGGNTGSLPAVLGLIALIALFSILQGGVFFTALNFANLLNQGTAIIVLAMGLVFVLLLGEIDLSAGFAAGTCAAVLGVTLTNNNWPWPLARAAALATGLLIGLVLGVLVARLGIPSFVVTLAAFLGLQGVMLLIIGEGGTIPIQNEFLLAIMNNNMPVWAGWLLWIVVVLGYAGVSLRAIQNRRKHALVSPAPSVWIAKVV
ncbi:MAG: ABC transporter permease, partial [Actinomycetota bacterium]|nr:ABC transporter permease [Actinomycetota bacterium]